MIYNIILLIIFIIVIIILYSYKTKYNNIAIDSETIQETINKNIKDEIQLYEEIVAKSNQDIMIINNELDNINSIITNLKAKKSNNLKKLNIPQDEIDNNLNIQTDILNKLMIKLQNIIDTKNKYIAKINKLINEKELLFSNIYDQYNKYLNMNKNIISDINSENQSLNDSINNNIITSENGKLQLSAAESLMAETEQGCKVIEEKNLEIKTNEVNLVVSNMSDKTSNQDKLLYPFYQNANNNTYSYLSNLNTYVTNEYTTLPNSKKQLIDIMEKYSTNPTFDTFNINNTLLSPAEIQMYLNNFKNGDYTIPANAKGTVVDNINNIKTIQADAKKAYNAYVTAESQNQQNSKIVVQQIVNFLNDKSAYFKLLRSQEIALRDAELLKQEQILDEKIKKNTDILSENESMLLQLTTLMEPYQQKLTALNNDLINYNKQIESYNQIYIKAEKTPDTEQTYTDIINDLNVNITNTQAKINDVNKQLNVYNTKYVILKSAYNKASAANKVLVEQDNPAYILQNLVNKSVATDYGASLIYNAAALNDLRIIEKTIYPLLFQQWIITPGIFYVNKIFNAILDGNNDVKLFHKKCDLMGGTISLITEKYTGNRIGGYTSLSFGLKQGQLYDPDAFIFDIAKGIIYNTQVKYNNNIKIYHKQGAIETERFDSIYMDSELGPVFGTGYLPDLGIWYNTDERITGNDKNNYKLNITSSVYVDETKNNGLFIYNDNNNLNKQLGIYNLEVFQVFYVKLLPFYIDISFANSNGSITNFDYDKYITGSYNGWLLPFNSLNLLYRNSSDGPDFSKSVCLKGPTIYYVTLKPLVGTNPITVGIYVNVSLNTFDKYIDLNSFVFQIYKDPQNKSIWTKSNGTNSIQIDSNNPFTLVSNNIQIDFKNKKVLLQTNSGLQLQPGNYDFIDCEIYQVKYTNQSIVKQIVKSNVKSTINLLTKLSNNFDKFEQICSLAGPTCIIMSDESGNKFGGYTNYGYNITELYDKPQNDQDTNIIGARIFESINMFHRNMSDTSKNITLSKGKIIFGSDFNLDLSTGILKLGANSNYNTIDNLNNNRLLNVMNGNNITNTKLNQNVKIIDIEVYQILYNNIDIFNKYIPLTIVDPCSSSTQGKITSDCYKQIWKAAGCPSNLPDTFIQSALKWANSSNLTINQLTNDAVLWATLNDDAHKTRCYTTDNTITNINQINNLLTNIDYKLIYDLSTITKDPNGNVFYTNCCNMGANILICSYIDSNNIYRKLMLYSTKSWNKIKYSDNNSFIYDMNKNSYYNINVNKNQTIYIDDQQSSMQLVFGDITINFSDIIELKSTNPLLYLDSSIKLKNLTVYQVYQTDLYQLLSNNKYPLKLTSLNLLCNLNNTAMNNSLFHSYCDFYGETLTIIQLANNDTVVIYTSIPLGLYKSYQATDKNAFAYYITKQGEYRQLYNSNINININSTYALSIGNLFVDTDNKQIVYDKNIFNIIYPTGMDTDINYVSTDITSISVYNVNNNIIDLFYRLKWIPNLKSLNLLYKGSVDGMDINNSTNPDRILQNKFHFNCDNAGPTLTIVRDTNGNIYGGYTSKNWTSDTDNHINDENAFIFTLSNGQNNKYSVNTIYVNKTQTGPCFGDFNNGKNNKLNIMQSGRNTINTPLLSGDTIFTLAEIEVYQVTFNNITPAEINSPLANKLKTL